MAEPWHGEPPEDDGSPDVVTIRTVESTGFRTYHANGALGGINQSGEMYLAFFAERSPRTTVRQMYVFGDGVTQTIPEGTEREEGTVRELQAAIYMAPETALEIAHFVLRNLDKYGYSKEPGGRKKSDPPHNTERG